MANKFDPSKDTTDKKSGDLNTNESKPSADGSRYQSTPKNVWRRQIRNVPNQQMNSLSKQQAHVYIIERETKPYWETEENSSEDNNQTDWEGSQDEQRSAYYEQEYHDYDTPQKKEGLAVKIDRFVQRFPVLSKFYKQPPYAAGSDEPSGDFHYGRMPGTPDANEPPRELTADELALNKRYTNKAHIKCITLDNKTATQPVDASVNQETNDIYLCDVGRSLVEIFSIDGTLQHVINDAAMLNFQPTAIAVSYDGTVIVSSNFNHCLHMYRPTVTPNQTSNYAYQRFKLGVPGSQIHEFYYPAGITIDNSDGYLYVCDRGNRRIQVITPDGICERVIELVINGKQKQLVEPVRVAVQYNSDQLVCIVDAGDAICFVPKYAYGQVSVQPFYVYDADGLGLGNATGVAVDANDRIFIADTDHHRIVVCTQEGYFITSFGTEGDAVGQLKYPCSVNLMQDGTAIVVDAENKRIQIFGLADEQAKTSNSSSAQNSNTSNNDNSSANIDQPLIKDL